MRDKLLLLHKFLNDMIHIADEDELARLTESYADNFDAASEDDVINELWNDARMLCREILFLKTNGADAARSRRISALSEEERSQLEETKRIIDENRFSYHFQPIVNTSDGSIYSYEALMRPESDIGLVPSHILRFADLMGRLNDIERATFLNVLNIIDSDKEKFGGRKVFINSIPKTKLDGDAFRRVGELLMKHSDTAVVELIEESEPDDNELNAIKERYRNMDIKIAIDDYGTGYSNVKNLLRYMPNYVKIDRSLLSDIQSNPKKRHFVREIIEFCHGNGIMALAEGVETAEELRTVILLGADLIQGFYTSRPSAEIIPSIPYEIRQEIKLYRQERQDGKDQQIYAAESTERIQLERLVKEGYQCILVGKDGAEYNEVAVIGSPSLDTDIHIEAAKDFKGRIILENVHLSNIKDRPCIDLSENSDVTLVLNGENKLDNGGIRVPEGARMKLEGEGNVHINIDAAEYFGIGNDISSRHGELIFDQSGTVTITSNGQKGVGIGSGLGGDIMIHQGKYVLNMNIDTGTGIGALYDDSRLDINSCDINADISSAKGVAIGSLSSNADIHICKSSAKLFMGGGKLTALGTVDGADAKVLINDAIVTIDMTSPCCTCAGALDGNSHVIVERAAFRAVAVGESALPFGGSDGNTEVSLIDADATVRMETNMDIGKYISSDNIKVVRGRTRFTDHGNEIDLNISE